MKHIILFLLLLGIGGSTLAQDTQPPYTPADERLDGFNQRKELNKTSLFNGLSPTNIGPTVMSGRVVDLAVSEKDPSHFYVAYASSGLWKTTNNGTSFTPIFDNEAVMTIGDIAVDWDNNTIWIGTGENNSSRSSYAGAGMYKSTDDGKSWEYVGLGETHHIGRIVLHPDNPNVAVVAALGHLYSPNEERGIYRTADGGKTWVKTLFVNKNAGGIDLIADPKDPNTLYAATWERQRRAWNFWESGEGSGIYKSEDGGNTWTKISTEASGFPVGEGVGRIGLTMYNDGSKNIVYALLDNQFRRPKEAETEDDGSLTKEKLRFMFKSEFLKQEEKKIQQFLDDNGFPEKYTAKVVMNMIDKDELRVAQLVEYLENANFLLFDTPVIGAEVYASEDGGKTWKKTHDDYLEGLYYSYGYYFGQIRVSPTDANEIYIMGVPILLSKDGGKSWENINGDNVHVDHHALWVNPNRPGHIINGNDGGVNISYDFGQSWVKCNSPAVGQFYAIEVDMARNYNVYGGFQDNGVWVGPNTYNANTRWHSSGQYPYKSIMGGDGMQVEVDTRDNNTVYTGFQFGNYFRINQETEQRTYITPKHDLGERPLRWNWQTPIHLSIHNQDILYMGSNKLHRSFNQGDDFDAISGDLTQGGKKGDVPYGTLTSITESPLKFGLLYTGSDDGLIYRTSDGGNTWNRLSDKLPKDMWVSRVYASNHKEGRVYASLNGYRWDDFNAYVYVSNDYGATWQQIGTDLPAEPVNVVIEDPHNENLVYVGTDHGLYASIDGGTSFMGMNNDLPAVAVHDLIVHPTANDLIVGTHGRSLYKVNVAHLQALNNDVLTGTMTIFEIPKTTYNSRWGSQFSAWSDPFEPSVSIPIFVKKGGSATLTIKTSDDVVLKTTKVKINNGINYAKYDLSIDQNIAAYEKSLSSEKKEVKLEKADNEKYYLQPGKYTVEVTLNGATAITQMEVKKPRQRRRPEPMPED